MMFSGLTLISIALAVMISALIRMIQGGQLRQRVQFGQTGVRELAELTGITDARDLQDVFGPPGMNRIWSQVTLAVIDERKRLPGYLMCDPRLHGFSMIAALGALLIGHWTVQIGLLIAVIVQTGAWLSATRLPR